MTDVTELICGDHQRIQRLLATLNDAARYVAGHGRAGPEWMLATVWARIATLLTLHADAEQEICFLAIYGPGENGLREFGDAIAVLDDMRDAIAEARLFQAASPAWWRAVDAARRSVCDHIAAIECGPLAGFRARSSPRTREELGRQWVAFIAARRHDGVTEDHEFRAGRTAQRSARRGSRPESPQAGGGPPR